jgi:hypothetical protein
MVNNMEKRQHITRLIITRRLTMIISRRLKWKKENPISSKEKIEK